MSEETNIKTAAYTIGGGLLVYILWEGWGREFFLGDGTLGSGIFGTGGPGKGTDTDGSGGNGPLPGLTPHGGAGGSGGSGGGTGGTGGGTGGTGGGAGGSGTGGPGGTGGGVGDYTSLAAAINALAAGVRLPNIRTVSLSCAAGITPLVPSAGGKRICVLGYAITGPLAIVAKWGSSLSAGDLWSVSLDAGTTGNSGANLATAWPGYLFATQPSEALTVNLTSVAQVSVTYWIEAA